MWKWTLMDERCGVLTTALLYATSEHKEVNSQRVVIRTIGAGGACTFYLA